LKIVLNQRARVELVNDLSSIIAHIIAGFYENFSWIKWKVNVTHFNGKNDPNIDSFGRTQIRERKPCQKSMREFLIQFSHNMKQKIKQINRIESIPHCIKTEFVKIEMVNSDTTRIIIPGGIFRPIATKRPRSIIHLRNDTIYRNQIAEGIIHNTEIYRLIQ